MVVKEIQGLYAEGLAAQRTAFWELMKHIRSQERELTELRRRVRKLERAAPKRAPPKPTKKSAAKRRRS